MITGELHVLVLKLRANQLSGAEPFWTPDVVSVDEVFNGPLRNPKINFRVSKYKY